MITHLEPAILECEVRWALGSITTNEVSGGDGIPVELFKILNDAAAKVLCPMRQHIWKIHQRPRDWKRSVFISMSKNVHTARQLRSFHMIARLCSKSLKLAFRST